MRNLSLLTDLYQFTMANAYVESGIADKVAVFDLFYRRTPVFDMCIACGLEQAIEYVSNIRFEEDDIKYLKGLNLFGDKFIQRLREFKFTGDMYAVKEGEIVFAGEPIITIVAPIFEAQILETALLNIINHQTLIATKSFKICQEAKGAVAEFGLRRAQGPDAGIYGARAAIVGGCTSTSNVLAGRLFDVRVSGTHGHSFVMSYKTELEAFRKYAEIYPDNCILLVDTYDTLASGVPNAITVFKELKAKGHKPLGIRLDSGDLAYLSKKARDMLDQNEFYNVKIFASGDIDEHIISSLKTQGAKIDMWGIGTKLITSMPNCALGGVYKLAAMYEDGILIPKIKVSNTQEKTTNPGFKTVYRIFKEDGMAAADLIALRDEVFDFTKPLTIFHPIETYKRITFVNYKVKNLTVQVFERGKLVYNQPELKETVLYTKKCSEEFWDEYKRLINPHEYKVDLSVGLYSLKNRLLSGI